MAKIILISLVLIITITGLISCSGNSSPNTTPIPAKWITVEIAGDTASIPVSKVTGNVMTHFGLNIGVEKLAFMAYELNGKTHVRSNICPPCRSVGFSLKADTLVCDTCATTFNAETGEGIEGACIDFPKAAVSYSITDGNILMSGDDLIAANEETLQPGVN